MSSAAVAPPAPPRSTPTAARSAPTPVMASPARLRRAGRSSGRGRRWVLLAVATSVLAALWTLPRGLGTDARLVLSVFTLTVLAWSFTSIKDVHVAVGAVAVLVVAGVVGPGELLGAATDPTMVLLLAAFVIAAGVGASGLARRLAVSAAARARSVRGLFHGLTGAVLVTAFLIPATSGRAALLLPVYVALAAALPDRRLRRALALLVPTVVLLSAVASLLGAGAHLVTNELIAGFTGTELGFVAWMVLGLPFAVLSCHLSAEVVLRLFLRRDERRRPLHLTRDQVAGDDPVPTRFTGTERRAAAILAVVVALWASEPWHGVDPAWVAVFGAVVVLVPRVGLVGYRGAWAPIPWNLLVFLAATLVLGHALVDSGAAGWLGEVLFAAVLPPGAGVVVVVAVVAVLSLLAHIVITSRTARSSVLVPLILPLALSAGLNPVALAFLSTAAAGFCQTLPASAKPVAMFADRPDTFVPADLRRLSTVLLPLHLGLLMVFAFAVWPLLGLPLHTTLTGPVQTVARTVVPTPPALADYRDNGGSWIPAASGDIDDDGPGDDGPGDDGPGDDGLGDDTDDDEVREVRGDDVRESDAEVDERVAPGGVPREVEDGRNDEQPATTPADDDQPDDDRPDAGAEIDD